MANLLGKVCPNLKVCACARQSAGNQTTSRLSWGNSACAHGEGFARHLWHMFHRLAITGLGQE